MSEALATQTAGPSDEAIEKVLIRGDLSGLTDAQRLRHYMNVCASLGLNPLTSPFDYLALSGKTVLYAKRDATEQLRKLHGVSIIEVSTQEFKDVYTVIAKASDKTGRTDVSTGVVPLGTLKGETLANALMKAETKAKRRVTLSICGLGMLDESELETVKGAQPANYIVEAPITAGATPAPGSAGDDGASGAVLEGRSRSDTSSEPLPMMADPLMPLQSDAPLKIVRVEAGRAGARALVVFSNGEELPVYTPQLAALAEHICQEGVPVVIETKTSAAGRVRLEKLSRMGSVAAVEAPSAASEAF
jgi:hypothetical protein